MQKKVVDEYVRLFESAKVRQKSYDNLEKLVKKRIRKLEVDKLKFQQVLIDIKKNKELNRLDQQQFENIESLIKQFDELTSKLSLQELELVKKYQQNHLNILPLEASSTPVPSSSSSVLDKLNQSMKNQPSPKVEAKKSPSLTNQNSQQQTTTPQNGPEFESLNQDIPDKSNENNDPSELSNQSQKLQANRYPSTSSPTKTRTYSDADQTLIEPEFDEDSFEYNIYKYYPQLRLKKPIDFHESNNYTLPNLNLTIDRNDYVNLMLVQNIFFQLGVPYELWGVYVSQYLHPGLLSEYLQLELPITWYQIVSLVLANQDYFVSNCNKIEDWCKKRPKKDQRIHEFLYEFKLLVQQSSCENSFQIEKSILVSLLNSNLPNPEFNLKLKKEDNRNKFYTYLFKQIPISMTF